MDNRRFFLRLTIPLLFTTQVCSATTGLPFTSSFESGDFSEWQGGREPSLTVSSRDASDGSYAARAVMTLGQTTDNYKDFYFGDHPQVNGTAISNAGLWLRLDSKFEEDFQFVNGSVHKIAILNFCDNSGQRRYQIIINVAIKTGQYFIENLRWNADGSWSGSLPGLSENVGSPVSVRFGQWDRLKLYIRPNTPGRSDGIVQLWVNGVLKSDYSNVAMRENTQYNPNKLILSNYVNTPDAAGVQWWDNFYLGDTDPDTDKIAPSPPLLRSVN